jgi:sulfur relay protein TusB/DsrH
MTLHCLYRLPDSPTAARLLAQLGATDVVLLLGEAVVLARDSHPELATWVASGARLYALTDDLSAYGIDTPAPEVRAASYADWVSLSEACATQTAWH